jgi:hypothetical protein
MDRDARRRLIDTALSLIRSGSLVAVPAEDYFAGNTDDGSFGRGGSKGSDTMPEGSILM